MAVLITVEAVAIALLAVLVAGLLRSHAEILRALHDAGIDTGHEQDSTSHSTPRSPVVAQRAGGAQGADVVGVTPDDESIVIGVVGAQHDTALAFLSTGCLTCAGFWSAFAERGAHALPGARSVIVTKGASEESGSKVRELAPRGVPVIMSSQAWADYGVPGAPYFVYVDGASGRVTGEGTASGWDQLASLLRQAADDGVLGANRAARTDAEREARADRELLAAGYQPGDARLHPEPGSPASG
jgi:hypothetical protein